MNRASWQQLAEERVLDAGALLDAGRWSAAYYLAGYAVECGLKACVLAFVEQNPAVIFFEKRYSERCWTHDLDALFTLANIAENREIACEANRDLGRSWSALQEWSEQDRYRLRTEAEARELFSAVIDPSNGVLTWIKARW